MQRDTIWTLQETNSYALPIQLELSTKEQAQRTCPYITKLKSDRRKDQNSGFWVSIISTKSTPILEMCNNFEHSWRNTADSALRLFQNCEAAGNQPSASKLLEIRGKSILNTPPNSSQEKASPGCKNPSQKAKFKRVLLYHLPPPRSKLLCQQSPLKMYLQDLVCWVGNCMGLLVWSKEMKELWSKGGQRTPE